MNSKKQAWIIGFVVLGLVFFMGILLLLRQEKMILDEGLRVSTGTEEFVLTAEDFGNIRISRLQTVNNEEIEAYLITDIIAYLEVSLPEEGSYYLSTRDGNRLILSEEEVRERKAALIQESGRDFRLRLVLPYDPFRNRWLKDVVILEIE